MMCLEKVEGHALYKPFKINSFPRILNFVHLVFRWSQPSHAGRCRPTNQENKREANGLPKISPLRLSTASLVSWLPFVNTPLSCRKRHGSRLTSPNLRIRDDSRHRNNDPDNVPNIYRFIEDREP